MIGTTPTAGGYVGDSPILRHYHGATLLWDGGALASLRFQATYTTDGSTPSAVNGTLYSGAFQVAATATVKAVGVQSGLDDSSISEVVYTIVTDGRPVPPINPRVTPL